MKGVVLYTIINNSGVLNHVMSAYPCEQKAFTMFYDGKMQHEMEENLMGQWISQIRLKVEVIYSSISSVSDFMTATKNTTNITHSRHHLRNTL